MRLINLDDAVKVLEQAYPNDGQMSCHDAVAVIGTVPTIEPRKQGKWIDEGQYADFFPHHAYRCSECGHSKERMSMASIDKITVDVCVTIPDETVTRCLNILSMYLTDNPDKTLSIDNVNVDGKDKRYLSIRNIVHCADCVNCLAEFTGEYRCNLHGNKIRNMHKDYCTQGEKRDGRDNIETE